MHIAYKQGDSLTVLTANLPAVFEWIKQRDGLDKLPLSATADDIAQFLAKSVPEGVPFVKLKAGDPALTDREFRDAWEPDAKGGLSINLEKAKSIKRGQIEDAYFEMNMLALRAMDAPTIAKVESLKKELFAMRDKADKAPDVQALRSIGTAAKDARKFAKDRKP